MNRWWTHVPVLLVGLLLLAGCTDSSGDASGTATTSSAKSTSTQVPVDQCADVDESQMTLQVDPKIAPAGSVLYVVWADDVRGTALWIDDGEQIWLLMIGASEAESETFPFETVGTYPPKDAYSPGVGYVRLPDSLRDGCYILMDGSDSGMITVRSSS